MSSLGNYNRNIPRTLAAITNVSSTPIAALSDALLGSRKSLMIKNPSTNTLTFFINFSTTSPLATNAGSQFQIAPGEWIQDDEQICYQGEVRMIASGAGPENASIYLGA